MMIQCRGCGAIIQNEDKALPGYTPKVGSDYCQRCYRIKHYDDVTVTYRDDLKPEEILSKVQEMNALVIWVVDVFDFESNIIDGLNRHFNGKDILLVLTKTDLLPSTLAQDKLLKFVYSRLKEKQIEVLDIVVTGNKGKWGMNALISGIEKYNKNGEMVVVGVANAGKSTILNALTRNENDLTMSRYPGTTLGFTKMKWRDYTIYDTPGLHLNNSLIFLMNDERLKYVIPQKQISPRIFQLHSSTSFSLSGLARIDIVNPKKGSSAVIYASDRLNVHRGKVKNADALWLNHYGELLDVTVGEYGSFKKYRFAKKEKAIDICIFGLGWLCFKGEYEYIDVWCNESMNMTFRKAMI